MLPYDGLPVEEQEASLAVAQQDKVAPSLSSSSAAPRPSTSAWQWDAQWGLYFNSESKQWAKPLPDGSWEYADAVQSTEEPARKKIKKKRIDRDDPEQEDEKFDPYAIPEEQIWPGGEEGDDYYNDDEEGTNRPDPYANAPLLRLVVADPRPDTAVLPAAQQVASIDPGEPVSLGRDKSFERRIRLKELAVSKSHATIFWTVLEPEEEEENSSGGGGYWAIVDNASTHGTFVRAEGEKKWVRLSEAKVASVPHRLYHLDSIRVGTTIFTAHIHPSFACSICSVSSDSSNLIPLVTEPSSSSSSKDKGDSTGFQTKTKEQKEQERREQMAGLKAQFLKPKTTNGAGASSGGGSVARAKAAQGAAPEAKEVVGVPAQNSHMQATLTAKPAFIDRAAARRQRDVHASLPVPISRKLPSTANPSPFFTVPGATASSSAAAAKPVDPFGADSRGAQLLAKLAGGGTADLGTLIEARTTSGGDGRRAGLGSKELVVGVENVAAAKAAERNGGTDAKGGSQQRDWRDAGRERSWKRFREL
ncbi:hypothetical protein JCM10908_006344 [Rhodotorula pacifica]|uniref:uncharacterized protein n=1 Tax=Rhodotorula pacifica TaxID=1495444 RepID=UPI00316F6F5A